jgi:hypothetical protein
MAKLLDRFFGHEKQKLDQMENWRVPVGIIFEIQSIA